MTEELCRRDSLESAIDIAMFLKMMMSSSLLVAIMVRQEALVVVPALEVMVNWFETSLYVYPYTLHRKSITQNRELLNSASWISKD